MYFTEAITDNFSSCLKTIRSHVMFWSAQRPIATLTIVIISCVILLPAITATALMPIVFLLDLSHFLSTKGIIYVIYTILIQGFILIFLLLVLFLVAFAIATSASVLHSYNFFTAKIKN